MKDNTKVNGRYYGTTTLPEEKDQDKYVFLPAVGYRDGSIWRTVTEHGNYWSSTPISNAAYRLDFGSYYSEIKYDSLGYDFGFAVRCVRDK